MAGGMGGQMLRGTELFWDLHGAKAEFDLTKT